MYSVKSNYRILYKSAEGVLAIMSPADNCELSLEEIAEKDVPAGFPYKIVLATELPEEDQYRNSWTIDDSLLTDGVGGEHGNPSEAGYLVQPNHKDGTPKTEDEIQMELNSILWGDRP
jgi:hypothetical protein